MASRTLQFCPFSNTVEHVLGDLWFGRPQSLARIVSNNKVPGVSEHLLNATGSFGLTDDSFTCYERPDHAHFRQ